MRLAGAGPEPRRGTENPVGQSGRSGHGPVAVAALLRPEIREKHLPAGQETAHQRRYPRRLQSHRSVLLNFFSLKTCSFTGIHRDEPSS